MASKGADVSNDVRNWIEMDFCPTPRAPGPASLFAFAFAAATAAYLVMPVAEVFLAAATIMFAASMAITLRIRGAGEGNRNALAAFVPATVAFAWAYGVYYELGTLGALLPHVILSAGALTLTLAQRTRFHQYTVNAVTRRVPHWTERDMAEYAEFLIARRPCPGANRIARELYRRASQRLIDRPWSRAPRVALMRRYAELLESGTGGGVDADAADRWARMADLADVSPEGSFPADPSDQSWATLCRVPPSSDGDGLPTWRIPVSDTAQFLDAEGSLSFCAFLLREAAVVACVLRLSGDRNIVHEIHRVFDVADAEVEAHLVALEHHLRWRIELCNDIDGRTVRTLEAGLSETGFMEAMDRAIAHNRKLGCTLDSTKALAFVETTLDTLGGALGVEAAWQAIEAACLKTE